MKREPLVNIEKFDELSPIMSADELDEYLPQKGAMRHLDEVVEYVEQDYIVGVKNVRSNEFWVPGHFPEWPVLPGIVLLEVMGQLVTVLWGRTFENGDRLMMFGGIDAVKFRGAIMPGDRVYVIAKKTRLNMRMSKFDCQAIKNGKIVCEAKITGVLGPSLAEAKRLAEQE